MRQFFGKKSSVLEASSGCGALETVIRSFLRENYLILNAYMKEMNYEMRTQQKALDPTTVLSNIGGNMGLFLGMSVITLGEIFVFIVKSMYGCGNPRRRDWVMRHQRDPRSPKKKLLKEEREKKTAVKKTPARRLATLV